MRERECSSDLVCLLVTLAQCVCVHIFCVRERASEFAPDTRELFISYCVLACSLGRPGLSMGLVVVVLVLASGQRARVQAGCSRPRTVAAVAQNRSRARRRAAETELDLVRRPARRRRGSSGGCLATRKLPARGRSHGSNWPPCRPLCAPPESGHSLLFVAAAAATTATTATRPCVHRSHARQTHQLNSHWHTRSRSPMHKQRLR